jgi:hypothetical protein
MWNLVVPVGSELNEGLGRDLSLEALRARMTFGFEEIAAFDVER